MENKLLDKRAVSLEVGDVVNFNIISSSTLQTISTEYAVIGYSTSTHKDRRVVVKGTLLFSSLNNLKPFEISNIRVSGTRIQLLEVEKRKYKWYFTIQRIKDLLKIPFTNLLKIFKK